nr:DNA polymerase-like [Tanacetum cinerariifolium]
MEHASLNEDNLKQNKEEIVEYLRQDVLLLGGIMQRAQEIFYEEFEIDIKSKITLPLLALSIFRKKFYDDNQCRIYIPSQNTDQFIRKGYYEGHADAYIPYDSIKEEHLDTMLGFVLSYVECPTDIKRPFLPYHGATGTLIFPTGKFSGVYYTEELKYAKNLGYKINMLYGYFYERKESPFKEIISVLYKKRLEAKNAGHIAVSYVYMILINSLYGTFGINPLSSKTLIGDENDLKRVEQKEHFQDAELLGEDTFVMSFKENIGVSPLDQWKPPSNSTVQLAAAIIASVRTYMYPYISRDDCYYTDTDSVVLSQPLPEELISSSILDMSIFTEPLSETVPRSLSLSCRKQIRLKRDKSEQNWTKTGSVAKPGKVKSSCS